ncbi:hypothetical protein D3C72_2484950 [compost metagenome]
MKWGTAPQYLTALAVATNVSVGRRTSSLAATPDTINDICKAAVPLTTATAYLAPVKAVI